MNEPHYYKMDEEDPLKDATMFIDVRKAFPKNYDKLDWATSVWSPNNKYLAYVTKSSGSDWKSVQIKNLETMKTMHDGIIDKIKFNSPAWDPKSEGFFYSRYDDVENTDGASTQKITGNRVYYHRLGTKQPDDILIYERPDQPYSYSAFMTDDSRFLILSTKKSTEEMNLKHFVDLQQTGLTSFNQKFQFYPIIDEWVGSFTIVHNEGTRFYILTNYKADHKRLVTMDVMVPGEQNWVTLIEGDENFMIESMYYMYGKLVVSYQKNSADGIRVYNGLNGIKALELISEVKMPGRGEIEIHTGDTIADNAFVFSYISYTVPGSYYRLDLDSIKLERFYRNKAFFDKTGYKEDEYIDEYIQYPSKDGTMVPMTIIRKKSVLPDLSHPPAAPILTHMTAYGGFGATQKPSFTKSDIFFYKNMQALHIIAHIRGGGENGKQWHEQAKKEHRQNAFDDFEAAAEYIIRMNYTDPKHLVISGGSNGGTLVSVVANQRPDLFALVQCRVPVTDMLRYQKFTAGSAWIDEYGSSDDKGTVDYLLKYSPLHNVKA